MHIAGAIRGPAGQDSWPLQKLQGDAGAHDIDDRIQRAYLVKMNRIKRLAVDFRLCGTDFEEKAFRAFFDPGRKPGGFYQLSYLRKTPMRTVPMSLPVRVSVIMFMSVSVIVIMGVFMLMMMGLLMLVHMFMFVGMIMLMHIQVGTGDALDNSPFRMEMPAIQVELLQFAVEGILRDTHINQGRQEHIAADSADDV
jgi:hypothetical protein